MEGDSFTSFKISKLRIYLPAGNTAGCMLITFLQFAKDPAANLHRISTKNSPGRGRLDCTVKMIGIRSHPRRF